MITQAAKRILLVLLLASPLPARAGDDASDSPIYAELELNGYAGAGRFTQEAYLEFALGDDGVVLWVNPYHEAGYSSTLVGVGKAFGPWTVALGAGQARFDGMRVATQTAWLEYAADKTELMVTVQRYGNGEPAFWQGYAQRRLGRYFLGVYGETEVGIGPAATLVVNDHLRLRLTVPVVQRGDTRAMLTLILMR